jgi:hypothetical protein
MLFLPLEKVFLEFKSWKEIADDKDENKELSENIKILSK